jgi:hypothetical protein
MFCADGRIIGFMDYKPRLFDRDGTALDPASGELWWPLTCEPPYVVKAGDKYGYVDKWLRPLMPERFDAVGPFRNGVAAVRLGNKHGLIRANGAWLIEPQFDMAHPLQNGTALAKIGGRAGLIDVVTGDWITRTPFDDVCEGEHGIVGVMRDGKVGVIEQTGAEVIEPRYDTMGFGSGYISSGRTGLIPVQSRGKWGFVDLTGNEVIPTWFDAITRFDRGMSWAERDGEWCAIDRRGNKIPAIPCQTGKPTNISYRSAFSCRITQLLMPDAPPLPPAQMDRPLIRPKSLD